MSYNQCICLEQECCKPCLKLSYVPHREEYAPENIGFILTVKLRKFPETGFPSNQGLFTTQWYTNFSRKQLVVIHATPSANQFASK